jgi:multicomponent Na+:H+ antiporter subunit C
MTYLPYVLAVWLVAVGLFGIVTSRNLIHLALCVTVAQSGTYVLLLAIGYRSHGTAPVFSDVPPTRRAVDPVVQAMTLTDIVVGVTVASLLLALAVKAHEHTGTLDPSELRDMRG